MQLNEPYLIINLTDNRIIFFVVTFNENKDYKLIKNIAADSNGILNGKIVDINLVSELIKKKVNFIEDELDHFFSQASVIINPNNINCLNVSGYKKLNGSQVSKEDIAYILNEIKKTILFNEKKYSVVHLFNSNFSLDSDNLENLPIGLFGDFYNQNMTFFLANKSIFKNLRLIFDNCGINIDRIILKPFADGISYSLKNKNDSNFSIIELKKKKLIFQYLKTNLISSHKILILAQI